MELPARAPALRVHAGRPRRGEAPGRQHHRLGRRDRARLQDALAGRDHARPRAELLHLRLRLRQPDRPAPSVPVLGDRGDPRERVRAGPVPRSPHDGPRQGRVLALAGPRRRGPVVVEERPERVELLRVGERGRLVRHLRPQGAGRAGAHRGSPRDARQEALDLGLGTFGPDLGRHPDGRRRALLRAAGRSLQRQPARLPLDGAGPGAAGPRLLVPGARHARLQEGDRGLRAERRRERRQGLRRRLRHLRARRPVRGPRGHAGVRAPAGRPDGAHLSRSPLHGRGRRAARPHDLRPQAARARWGGGPGPDRAHPGAAAEGPPAARGREAAGTARRAQPGRALHRRRVAGPVPPPDRGDRVLQRGAAARLGRRARERRARRDRARRDALDRRDRLFRQGPRARSRQRPGALRPRHGAHGTRAQQGCRAGVREGAPVARSRRGRGACARAALVRARRRDERARPPEGRRVVERGPRGPARAALRRPPDAGRARGGARGGAARARARPDALRGRPRESAGARHAGPPGRRVGGRLARLHARLGAEPARAGLELHRGRPARGRRRRCSTTPGSVRRAGRSPCPSRPSRRRR